jgi:hypothetical protein
LLSGSEGIGVSESSENRMYPIVGSLVKSSNMDVSNILATRLFKPGDNVDQHRPVHKIVTEYCAAGYLVDRISNPLDPLSLVQCLPVIAPNGTVRDELRGLLGWMASLGNKLIEEAAIALDPYAVLANGDPSQLEPSSKRMLLSQLKEIEITDPHFRRADFWRRFSITGFFTREIMEDIKPIISNERGGHLRDLLLELLIGTQDSRWLAVELRQLVLNPEENKDTRILASRCLFVLDDYDFRSDLNILICESSSTSLNIAAEIFKKLGLEGFIPSEFEIFFLNCISLYPSDKKRYESVIGGRYFVKSFINLLSIDVTEWLLNSLTKNLSCTCKKKEYECDCRTGISKIAGYLLDHYFELEKAPFDPMCIWKWIENLYFPEQINVQNISSVKLLREDDALRQGIIAIVFGRLTERRHIDHLRMHKFGGHYSHAGLCFHADDHQFIVDLAFENNNVELWLSFMRLHMIHRLSDKRGPDSLRSNMRKQANQKTKFMQRWALTNRQQADQTRQEDVRWNVKCRRSMKRKENKERRVRSENIEYVQEHRELVESGQDWSCLVRFSELVLNMPDEIEKEIGDEDVVRNALRNCLSFIEPDIPNLQTLAELKCASLGLTVETVLLAACIEIMRASGNLEEVNPTLLLALRTNLNQSYLGVNEDENQALKAEVDRLIFPTVKSAEKFLRQYLEPQLADPKCSFAEVDLLESNVIFSSLRAELSVEWLSRFYELEPYALNNIFEIAVQYSEQEKINELILSRCTQLLSEKFSPEKKESLEQRRKFWFSRAFYFLSLEESKPFWKYIQADKNSIFFFNERSTQMGRSDHSYWPVITSDKVGAILEAFFDKWPKVPLPNNYGTSSPIGETAYRFLIGIIWTIGNDSPDEAIPVLGRLLTESRFVDIHNNLKSIKAEQLRKKSLVNFKTPVPNDIVNLLDNHEVVSVEGLRKLVVQELTRYQKDIDGGEFNVANRFYTQGKSENEKRLDEVRSVEVISERLSLILNQQNIVITSEHQTKNQNRIDITAAKTINGKRRLLVIEAKGQWHNELYSAATAQLYERYSIHPDAEHQGIYLVIWFGTHEKVANRKVHEITSAIELKQSIEDKLPVEIKGFIDVFVLDVSRY